MKEQIHGGDVYRHPDVIDFSSNMNPLGTPGEVIRAARESMLCIANYPDVRCERLIRALGEAEQVPENWLICGNGAAELIFALAFALRPKKALLPAPTFAEYEQALRAAGSEVCFYELSHENHLEADKSLAEMIRREKPEMVFLCNPNNPTGLLVPQDVMEEVRSVCRREHVFLVMDECFLDFVEDGEELSQKKYLSDRNIFILRAFTKRYAMAGLRLGYGICADESVLEKMREAMQPWSVSIPAQAAGEAALGEKEYVRRSMRIVRTEREYLRGVLQKSGFKVYDSRANYLFFRAPAGLREALLKRGIMIRSCANYRNLGEEYYRIAVRKHEDNVKLQAALEALAGEEEGKWQKQS